MSAPLLSLLVAFLLLAANAFYVAAEFALVKARGFRIDALAEEKQFGAALTQVNGGLLTEGAPDEVARDPQVRAVYLGEAADV